MEGFKEVAGAVPSLFPDGSALFLYCRERWDADPDERGIVWIILAGSIEATAAKEWERLGDRVVEMVRRRNEIVFEFELARDRAEEVGDLCDYECIVPPSSVIPEYGDTPRVGSLEAVRCLLAGT